MTTKIRVLHLWSDEKEAECIVRELSSAGVEFEAKLVRNESEYVSALLRGQFQLIVIGSRADFKRSAPEDLSAREIACELAPSAAFVQIEDDSNPGERFCLCLASPGGEFNAASGVVRVSASELERLSEVMTTAGAMREQAQGIDLAATIENHILAWSACASYVPLAEVLRRDKEIISLKLSRLLAGETKKASPRADAIRAFLAGYALEQAGFGIEPGHFVLFKEYETVEVVLEDSFGIQPGSDRDEIIVPHRDKALSIIVTCLFGKRSGPGEYKEIAAIMQLFSRKSTPASGDQDRVMRYKSMVWMVYLAISLVSVDPGTCIKGVEYLGGRFRELLDRAIAGELIDEDSRRPGFDGGRWENSLFGWLQGDDRRPFLLKLKRQFNLENRLEHANRRLLAEHRKCIFEQVLTRFC